MAAAHEEPMTKRGASGPPMSGQAGMSSMTGFARVDGSGSGCSWTWEARSLNARGIEMRFRLAAGFEPVEAPARKLAAERFSRGSLAFGLTCRLQAAAARYEIDRGLLGRLANAVAECRGETAGDGSASDIATLLTVRGVVETVGDEAPSPERQAGVLRGFAELLDELSQARREEGARLKLAVDGHLDEIGRLVSQASGLAAEEPRKSADRLRARLRELTETGLAEDRLAQEIAVIAARGDASEELERLRAHLDAVRELIGGGGAIGRRLDFLCQELGREANTLCAKSSALELTQRGIDLKVEIERLREQIRNVE